jgi:hypothetical protein
MISLHENYLKIIRLKMMIEFKVWQDFLLIIIACAFYIKFKFEKNFIRLAGIFIELTLNVRRIAYEIIIVKN